jgi:hypothetical protein
VERNGEELICKIEEKFFVKVDVGTNLKSSMNITVQSVKFNNNVINIKINFGFKKGMDGAGVQKF